MRDVLLRVRIPGAWDLWVRFRVLPEVYRKRDVFLRVRIPGVWDLWVQFQVLPGDGLREAFPRPVPEAFP